MKKYRVIANGVEYEVLIELVSDDEKAPEPQKNAEPSQLASAGGEAVKAPLTGTVTTVNVKAGDAVKKGQVLMILEAMKMENEILSPCDGRITSVSVTPGTAVEAGTALCSIGR